MNSDYITSKFWDRKIFLNKKKIFKSPIYLHKNKIIFNKIKKLNGKLLDIGFGYGYIEQLIDKHNSHLKVYGIDISSYAVKFAKVNYNGNFKKASILDIPFAVNFFDCVLSIDILEHLPKRKLNVALSNINKVLKNNGLLVVSVPINESRKDKLLNRHLRSYNSNIIENELTNFGFEIESKTYLYAFRNMYLIKNIINKIFKIKKPNLIILFASKK